jgi:hypothetical protein
MSCIRDALILYELLRKWYIGPLFTINQQIHTIVMDLPYYI